MLFFCLYVLMYFEKLQQEQLIKKFYELLNPGGFLILGKTDSMPFSEQNPLLPLTD
ncbi:MAG: CheR family methyltransferase [Candidatus Hodarchaeota archaeon]